MPFSPSQIENSCNILPFGSLQAYYMCSESVLYVLPQKLEFMAALNLVPPAVLEGTCTPMRM